MRDFNIFGHPSNGTSQINTTDRHKSVTRDGAMENEAFYWDGEITKKIASYLLWVFLLGSHPAFKNLVVSIGVVIFSFSSIVTVPGSPNKIIRYIFSKIGYPYLEVHSLFVTQALSSSAQFPRVERDENVRLIYRLVLVGVGTLISLGWSEWHGFCKDEVQRYLGKKKPG